MEPRHIEPSPFDPLGIRRVAAGGARLMMRALAWADGAAPERWPQTPALDAAFWWLERFARETYPTDDDRWLSAVVNDPACINEIKSRIR